MSNILFVIFIVIIVICYVFNSTYKYKETFMNDNKNVIQNKKISVIVLNYNRPHNIKKLVDNIKDYDIIDEIIISHGKKDTEILINHPKVINETTLRNKYYSATRFEIVKLAKNNIIMFLDDDMYPSIELINNFYLEIKKDNNYKKNIYGAFKRICNKDGYNTNTNNNYNIILTGLSFINKDNALKIWNEMVQTKEFKHVMDQNGNGEDLLFSYLIKKNGGECKYINGKYTNLDISRGFSANSNHYILRSDFCKLLNN